MAGSPQANTAAFAAERHNVVVAVVNADETVFRHATLQVRPERPLNERRQSAAFVGVTQEHVQVFTHHPVEHSVLLPVAFAEGMPP